MRIKISPLILIIIDKWRYFLAFFVVSALIAVLVALKTPSYYDAKTLLYPKSSLITRPLQDSFLSPSVLLSTHFGLTKEIRPTRLAIEHARSFIFFSKSLYERILPELSAVESWDPGSNSLIYDEALYDSSKGLWLTDANTGVSLKPSQQEAHEAFLAHLTIYEQKDTGLLTIEIRHLSPQIAQKWLSLIVGELNYFMSQVILRTLDERLTAVQDIRKETSLVELKKFLDNEFLTLKRDILSIGMQREYVFGIIEPPVIPERKSGPSRPLICIIVTLVGTLSASFLFLVYAYILNGPSLLESKLE